MDERYRPENWQEETDPEEERQRERRRRRRERLERERRERERQVRRIAAISALILVAALIGIVLFVRGRLSTHRADVYIGKDGVLLQEPQLPDTKALETTTDTLASYAQAHQDVPQTLMLVPCAAAIRKDLLPQGAQVHGQLADLNNIATQVGPSVSCVDLTGVMEKHAGEDIYFSTDSHWTTLGASYGVSAAAGSLGIVPVIESWNKYLVSDTFTGDLARRAGRYGRKDKIWLWEPKESISCYTKDPQTGETSASLYDRSAALRRRRKQFEVFPGGSGITEIQSSAQSRQSLLLIGDGDARVAAPLLTPYYRRVVLVDPERESTDIDTLVKKYDIGQILYVYDANNFVTDQQLVKIFPSRYSVSTQESEKKKTESGAAATTAAAE